MSGGVTQNGISSKILLQTYREPPGANAGLVQRLTLSMTHFSIPYKPLPIK
jgi:hypothetical protein